MNRILMRMLKYFRNVFLVLIFTSVILIFISKFMNYDLSNTFFYSGIIFMIIGGLSLLGSSNMSSDPNYVQSQSVSSKSVYENSIENLNMKFSSYRFLTFMSIVGLGLIIICVILSKSGFTI